ncbi:hypothetical protein P5V15_011624 [Pogonomyrmex californicus]
MTDQLFVRFIVRIVSLRFCAVVFGMQEAPCFLTVSGGSLYAVDERSDRPEAPGAIGSALDRFVLDRTGSVESSTGRLTVSPVIVFDHPSESFNIPELAVGRE